MNTNELWNALLIQYKVKTLVQVKKADIKAALNALKKKINNIN